MNNNLLILGAGQYGMIAKEIAESMNCFAKIDFLDDQNEIAIDRLENYESYIGQYSHAIVAIGDSDIRLSYIQKLEEACFNIPVLVSPRAYVAPSAQIMKGAIVEPMAVINANAMVAIGVFVCAGAIVNHNAAIGDGCVLQCGSVVAAGSLMLAKTKLNYSAVYYGCDKERAMRRPVGNDYKFEDGM